MPELPEVETVRRGLEPALAGRVIAAAEVRRPDLRWPLPAGLAERLAGARVTALRRRSKFLLADLDRGETLILHLGMSGRILIAPPRQAATPGQRADGAAVPGLFLLPQPVAAPHDHVVLHLDDGTRVTFNDPRRFGTIDLVPTAGVEAHRLLARLGPEPLGNQFDEPWLIDRFAGRRAPAKAVLLDQATVAGLGNIYVCEALHRAGIDPRRPARRIAAARVARLVPVIRDVLSDAIAAGGSSLRDYRRADGELGYFQHDFRVYGRTGAPCPTAGCDGTIRRTVQAGRSTFHCPRCQR